LNACSPAALGEQAPQRLGHERHAGGRHRADARREVHRLAGDAVLGAGRADDRSGDHLAAADAGMYAQCAAARVG
jgi:hypothetical protein